MENISVAEWGEVNITGNVLTEIKKLEEFSQNIIFCDPPYNLGSVWQIVNNKPEVKGKAVDFMNNKWEGLTGKDLESMFIDFFRVLKHGGYCVFAGQMRQAMAFQYYAIASGFDMIEPIYSYNISNFPKALDVSKSLDKDNGKSKIDLTPFGNYIKEKREEKKYSRKKLDEIMGTSTAVSWWEGRKDGIQLPSKKMYLKLKTILELDNRFDDLINWIEAEREIIGKSKNKSGIGNGVKGHYTVGGTIAEHTDITAPSSDLAKKYNGIKSSICPLKQTTEVWFIFRKPFKNGTITKDIIAYEDGDQTIAPSGLNIDGGRVKTSDSLGGGGENPENASHIGNSKEDRPWKHDEESRKKHAEKIKENVKISESLGRYPAQLFLDGSISYKREDIDLDNKDFLEFVGIDSDVISFMETEKAIDYVCAHLDKFNVSRLLDEQSGVLKSGDLKPHKQNVKVNNSMNKDTRTYITFNKKGDQGGCSRILHNAGFTLTELYQHIYYSKPSRYERNSGCDSLEVKNFSHDGRDKHIENAYQRHDSVSENNHPTLKSLKLLYNIIQLFKTVDIEKMKICIPFSGVRSEKIVWLSHGAIEENITAIEISEEYDKIGAARETFWIENDFFFKDEKEMQSKIKVSIEKDKEFEDVKQGNLFQG